MARVQIANATFSTRRMEALTDGVFAIAMTLLILDINVSQFGTVTDNAQLIGALSNESGSLVSFVVSFLMLGSMWAVHTRQFEYITRTDRHLTMINTLRLLAVVFMPLTTSISGEYSDILLGRIMLPLNFLLITALSYWQWLYATKKKRSLSENLTREVEAFATRRNIIILVEAVAVVIGSLFFGQWAFMLFILTPLVMRSETKVSV